MSTPPHGLHDCPAAASLLLEGADLLSPLLRALWRRATAAVSWLLVALVGRAVALVRRGVQLGGSQAAAGAGDAGGKQHEQQRQQQQRTRGGGEGTGGAAAWA
jgi:hypothetical protein